MTRAALTKLLILVILAFIICLPDFFSIYRESKVNFLCQPYKPCERGNQVKRGENETTEDTETKRKEMCDPALAAEWEKWTHACSQGNQSNMTDHVLNFGRSSDDSEEKWFVCQTNTDMTELHNNISSSALQIHLEVSVKLQVNDAETLNFTLYGHSNNGSLEVYIPEEHEEEEDGEKGNEGQEAFYCCLPALPTSETANQSRCLLWITNQTVSTATAKEKLPWKRTQKDEWEYIFLVLWMALLCLVFLVLLGQIYFGRCYCIKPTVRPVYTLNNQQLKDRENNTEIITPRVTVLNLHRPRIWSELSPIEEARSQEDMHEALLHRNVDCYNTANLHHRSHPSVSSASEEQAEESSTEMESEWKN